MPVIIIIIINYCEKLMSEIYTMALPICTNTIRIKRYVQVPPV